MVETAKIKVDSHKAVKLVGRIKRRLFFLRWFINSWNFAEGIISKATGLKPIEVTLAIDEQRLIDSVASEIEICGRSFERAERTHQRAD